MTHFQWVLRQVSRRLWVRASLIGFLGVLAAIFALIAERYVPMELPGQIGADAVGSILNIIASSMLAVTTFSLSVMIAAYGSVTSNVTPRATKLLMQDSVTQNVLSTFVGSFLFAIVGIVVLQTGAYGARGRGILFVVTIGVIALIVVSLLHWIDHLTRLGRVGETTDRVEQATREAIEARLVDPWLGGQPMDHPERDIPEDARPVSADAIGYVQHVDIGALARCAEAFDLEIFVAAQPGVFIYPHTPLAHILGTIDEAGERGEAVDDIRDAFTIGAERSFDQDPRFGLAVMSEIASRALSPAMNDTGTAIDVLGRMARLMSLWGGGSGGGEGEKEIEVRFPRVHVAALAADDLFDDAFLLLARDGAGLIEVQLRLQKTLAALAQMGDSSFKAAARNQARIALLRAQAALPIEVDRERLKAFLDDVAEVEAQPTPHDESARLSAGREPGTGGG